MQFNIITNMTEGCGLWHDYRVLRGLIEQRWHTVHAIDFQSPTPRCADVNIFLEVQVPSLFQTAAFNWVVPNPEWFFGNAGNFDKILCKTRHAQQLFSQSLLAQVGCNTAVHYVGFESRDFFSHEHYHVPNKRFLHVAGKSDMKNTEAILEAWRTIPYPLTLVTSLEKFACVARQTPGVTHHYKLSDDALAMMFRSHTFHLCPSKTEGWGHYIHEALGVGAVVLTTDAAPMNEICGVYGLIPSRVERQLRMSDINVVTADAVHNAVMNAAAMAPNEVCEASLNARTQFLSEREFFRTRFNQVLCEAETG